MRVVSRLGIGLGIGLLLMAAQPAFAGHSSANSILGLWMTQNQEAVVEFYPCNDNLCGRFHWLRDGAISANGGQQTARSLCRKQFIGGFIEDGEGHYKDGWIKDPEDDQTYNAELTLVDHETLHVYGYILLPLLGQTETWKRVNSSPACKPEAS